MHEAIAIVEFRNFPPLLYRIKSGEPIDENRIANFFEEVDEIDAPDNITLFEVNELTEIEI